MANDVALLLRRPYQNPFGVEQALIVHKADDRSKGSFGGQFHPDLLAAHSFLLLDNHHLQLLTGGGLGRAQCLLLHL